MAGILSAKEMQYCDKRTIERHGIPSLVLMERAALKVVETIEKEFENANRFSVICGPGNNGGDGVAIARLLHLKGKKVDCMVLGNSEKFSEQLKQEIEIADSYGMTIHNTLIEESIENAALTIDALFGIGLARGLSGEFDYAAKIINQCANKVLAVDIPSGYDSDSGKLLGDNGVKADITVTFAYMKKGMLLGDCKAVTGKIVVADVGIYLEDEIDLCATLIDDKIFEFVKPRAVDANKGSCGKLLVIAGSESIYGACYLSAKSALATGTGLVKIYTHKNNIASIQQNLPEAMYAGYDQYDEKSLAKEMEWASTILIGPGFGTSDMSKSILKQVLSEVKVPLVIDADGINLLAEDDMKELLKAASARVPVVITPHLKEMERLTGMKVADINYNMEKVANDFAVGYGCIIVLKNFTTIITNGIRVAFVNSGNEGLATPGSGDVLAGAIASFISQKVNQAIDVEVSAATYLHGKAGTAASERNGVRGVLASHIIDEFAKIEAF
jgi:NAD(P)H-hydrate epimerase